MKKIGVISDTHGVWDERLAKHFAECDEIWHAGDVCGEEIVERFRATGKVFRCVRGNADGGRIRVEFKDVERFEVEGVSVLLTHIGGRPGKYSAGALKEMKEGGVPKLFVCGHSHLLRVEYDKAKGMLYVNPGAAGKYGWQTARTLVRFVIDGGEIRDMEVVEMGEE